MNPMAHYLIDGSVRDGEHILIQTDQQGNGIQFVNKSGTILKKLQSSLDEPGEE